MNIKELEDRASLKELVDSISILADKKDFNNQVQLFAENAVSETLAGGKNHHTSFTKLFSSKEKFKAVYCIASTSKSHLSFMTIVCAFVLFLNWFPRYFLSVFLAPFCHHFNYWLYC